MRVIWLPQAKKEMRMVAKLIYCIKDDHIEVADFWDVRRDPGTLANQLK